jgi:SAM-dependent MidA family methyltransferase
LVLIEENNTYVNTSLRFQKESLQKFQAVIKGDQVEIPEPFFLPINLTSEILDCLPVLEFRKANNDEKRKEVILSLHRKLWEYSETALYLNLPETEKLKKQWLDKLANEAEECLNKLSPHIEYFNKYNEILKQVLDGSLKFDQSVCEEYFFEDLA